MAGHRAQVGRAVAQGLVERAGQAQDLVVGEVVLEARQGARAHLAHGLGEGLLDVGLHGSHGLVGHDGGDGVLLLVGLVDQRGGVHVRRRHGEEAAREVLGDDDGRVVLARADALLGVLARGNGVADLLVLPEFLGHVLT